jgi:hypothetical protein
VTNWAYIGDRWNSVAQSRPGSLSNAWNTSAQLALPKKLQGLRRRPVEGTRPPGTSVAGVEVGDAVRHDGDLPMGLTFKSLTVSSKGVALRSTGANITFP